MGIDRVTAVAVVDGVVGSGPEVALLALEDLGPADVAGGVGDVARRVGHGRIRVLDRVHQPAAVVRIRPVTVVALGGPLGEAVVAVFRLRAKVPVPDWARRWATCAGMFSSRRR